MPAPGYSYLSLGSARSILASRLQDAGLVYYSGGNGAAGKVVFSYLIDLTAPVVGTVNVAPSAGGFTSAAPTITATLTEPESPVSGCEYTTDGSNWVTGLVSGSASPWTCTGSPTSGAP